MLDDATTTFAGERPRLIGIARRVLATGTDAEDVVQDAWVRWQRYDWQAVDNPAAFLTTTTTRLAINATQTARARHETCAGPTLPEPADTSADPTAWAERADELDGAIGEVLAALTPAERAAYVLREAFEYPYDRVAAVVGTTAVNARQLVSRARRRLAADRRGPTDPAHHRRLLDAFSRAARHGDLDHLEEVLRHDI